MLSSLVNAVKAEYNSIHIWPHRPSPTDMESGPGRYKPRTVAGYLPHRDHNREISCRTSLSGLYHITLFGWPSRGGVIVLENATAPDFDYLHLDPLDPPLRRDADQDAEDAFCQALLRLGAVWWDSKARRCFVIKLDGADEQAHDKLDANENLAPTRRECAEVSVAWPSHPPGALCVLEWMRVILGGPEEDMPLPHGLGLISLARTMDERCQVLQRLGGRMYASIEEYEGPAFLKAWEENHQGEKRSLYVEEFDDPAIYGGHPDDALGKFVTPKGFFQESEKTST